MDNYIIAEDTDPETICPFPNELIKDVLIFEVKKNSKFGGILSRVDKEFQNGANRVIFHGVGSACAKCVSCVEVFKSQHKQEKFYQWNVSNYSKSKDVWTPADGEGLGKLVVEKSAPTIYIMISKHPFPEEMQCESQQITDEEFLSFPSPSKSTSSKVYKRLPTKPRRQGSRDESGTRNKWRRERKQAASEKKRQETNSR